MPCWYFEKKEIKSSPSYRDGIDSSTEARYRREGARFIVDAGTKLGLRYDTCATGVVYFHRFYMFHSFKEFPRHVTAACCLFLAGKVEETPKKCKDIIKISQTILTQKQFSTFGNDPREEVMTLERILLQTIKFDLQTEHPYAYLLKYAKLLKSDKEKTQKLVQMAWTFINDSLCTSLCLQWEPEIIAVSLMYLGTRLNKFDVTDWHGKMPGSKVKWWEFLVEDLTVELMEDICHQVLDLYSPANQPSAEPGDSPPPPPPAQHASRTPNSQGSDRKRSLPSTPSDPVTPGSQSSKSAKLESMNQSKKSTPQKNVDRGRDPSRTSSQQPTGQETTPAHSTGQVPVSTSTSGEMYGTNPPNPQAPPPAGAAPQYPSSTADVPQYNPYVSASQYQSSFMSQEGAQSLQTMMSQSPAFPPTQTQPKYSAYSQPPPPVGAAPQVPPPFGMSAGQYPPGYNPSQYPASAAAPGPPIPAPQTYPPPGQQFQGTAYSQYPQYSNYQQPPPQQGAYDQKSGHQYQGGGAYPGNQMNHQRPRSNQNHHNRPQARSSSSVTQVRITGR